MILDFSIGNFRSFHHIQTLDFRATGLISDDKEVDKNNVVVTGDQKVLKTIGLYGPNGSGKSNIVTGLQLFCELVESSLESEMVMTFKSQPFVFSDEELDQDGFFQMQLLIGGKKFRYGFTLLAEGVVGQEWLFGPAEKNETYYFRRTYNKVEVNKEWYEEGFKAPVENLRQNTLFLTFVSAYNGMISQRIRSFIVKGISFEDLNRLRLEQTRRNSYFRQQGKIGGEYEVTNQLVKDGKGALVLDWLKAAGLNYSNVSLEPSEFGLFLDGSIFLTKPVYGKTGEVVGTQEMELNDTESEGTKKFYYYIGWLYRLFNEGGVLVSDEIDNNFHPSLLKQFVRFFNDPSINRAGAQLLFTSHDTNLMQPEILRRDQIYFTEKSVKDETILYSLADLKGIRNNVDFARQYLAGFYGALPLLDGYKNESPS